VGRERKTKQRPLRTDVKDANSEQKLLVSQIDLFPVLVECPHRNSKWVRFALVKRCKRVGEPGGRGEEKGTRRAPPGVRGNVT